MAKGVFKDVEIETSQLPYLFECQLYDLMVYLLNGREFILKVNMRSKRGDCVCGCLLVFCCFSSKNKGPVLMEDLPQEVQVVALDRRW